MSNFWDALTLIASAFLFFAYLIVMFQIVADLFRDESVGGFARVLWILGLIFIPLLTAIVYIVARGSGMTRRQQAAAQRANSDVESYIRGVVGKSPASEIAEAKRLLDAGTISGDEFARLKAKALA